MNNKRVTLRDIAAASGYHFSTVSLALRGASSIPDSTRIVIKRVAAELGYSPDPVLSALVAYRQKRKTSDYAGTIIWLTNNTQGFHWFDVPHNRDYFFGAEQEAKDRGFVLEEIDLGIRGMNPGRVKQILHARRINCLLIPSQQASDKLGEFDWKQLFAVALGYVPPVPNLHLVSNNHSGMMEELIEQLRLLGYQRPGLVLLNKLDQRADRKMAAAYLGDLYFNDGFVSLAPLCLHSWDAGAFDRWFDAQKPDVLIGSSLANPELIPYLSAKGLRVPEDIGYADYNLALDENRYAGMKQNSERIGRVAVTELIRLFHGNECGPLPGTGQHTLLDGVWYAGPTVREQKPYHGDLLCHSNAGSGKAKWNKLTRYNARRLHLRSG